MKNKSISGLAFALLILAVMGCSCPILSALSKKDTPPPPRPTPVTSTSNQAPKASNKGDYDLTMDKYNKLKIGMARAEVESNLGGQGTEISSSTGGGVRFSVNKWEGDNFKSIILSFKNDKIMTKSQVGLK